MQFVHRGSSLEPRMEHGAFAMTLEQTEYLDAAPVGSEPHTLHFSSGDSEDVAATPRVTLAPLVTRFAWIKDGNRVGTYVKGCRGKLQLLAYVLATPFDADAAGEVIYAGPVMLTFKGLASKQVNDALKAHRSRVRKATRGQAPSVYFTLTLGVEAPRLAGSGQQQSRITPITLVEDTAFNPDEHYIGDALADIVEAEWETYQTWAQAWKQPGPNGDGEIREDDEDADAPVESGGDVERVQYDHRLPFPSKKYGSGATVQDLFDAGDTDALQALIGWCKRNPGHQALAVQATQAKNALEADDIPF
jgi:hypothetical protein